MYGNRWELRVTYFRQRCSLAWALALNKNAVPWTHTIRVSHGSAFVPMLRESFLPEILQRCKFCQRCPTANQFFSYIRSGCQKVLCTNRGQVCGVASSLANTHTCHRLRPEGAFDTVLLLPQRRPVLYSQHGYKNASMRRRYFLRPYCCAFI